MRLLPVLAALWLAIVPNARAETLKVAIPQRGVWDTGFVDFAVRAGFFQAEGLDVEPIYSQGGAQAIQAVLSGSMDITMGTGLLGTVGAFSKGAPIRVLSAEMTGSPDIYFYVKADSPAHSLKDLAGKTIGFSEPGSSSNIILLALLDQEHVAAHAVSAGGIPNVLTQVMSNQIDAGWGAPPFNLPQINAGALRIVARGSDAVVLRDETIRVNFTTAAVLAAKPEAIAKFNRVYLKTLDWAYTDPKALEYFAELAKIPLALARQVRDEFEPREALQPYEIKGLDLMLKQALDYKYTARPLSREDVAPLFSQMIRKPGP